MTIASLVGGQIIAIDAAGNARILSPGEAPLQGEVILESTGDQPVQVSLVGEDGTPRNVTDDVAQVIASIEDDQDPTQLGEEFDTAAGEGQTSSGTVLDTLSRVGDETIASTQFETAGLEGIGFSTTQSLTLLDQFRTLFVSPPSDTPPLSEDFTVALDNQGSAAIQFDDPTGINDHISDIEDDAADSQVEVVITRLPASGTLLYEGVEVTEAMLTEFDASGNVIGDLQTFDPTKFSYQNDDQSTGFILGVKNAPEGLDGDESTSSFLNWGEPTDDSNVRVLNFKDDQGNIVDQIFITTTGGDPTQYYADKNHIGYGLGVGGGGGIQEGETITIDMSQRPSDSVTLGLDGMGGWFEEGHNKETSVVIKVTLDDGTVIEHTETKTTSGNRYLFEEVTIEVPESSEGALITSVEVSTDGPGNWELRYLETNTPDDSFDYRAVDSDNNVSDESTVTLEGGENTPPIAIDDPVDFCVAYGTFNNDVWDYSEGEIVASYDGVTKDISGDGLKRGVSGDENGGPANQIQYNREEGKSEQFTINLEKPASEFSFTVSNLYKNEGGSNNHEQGKWVAYLGETAVASGMFVANEGSNKGSYSFSSGVAFDRVVFEAVDFVDEPARGSDSSDYFLSGFKASGSGAYAANEGETLVIPIEELLTNDYDPDSDNIRFTHVSEANNAEIWVEDGLVYIKLDEGFSGPTSFDYEITDDNGGFAEATVDIIVNPAPQPVEVDSIALLEDTVVEGDNLVFKVTLAEGVLEETEYNVSFGDMNDSATSNDVDLASAQFTNGVTYDENSGQLSVPVGVSAFSVIIPTIIDSEDEVFENYTLEVGGQSSVGGIADVTITQADDALISFHDFDQIDVGHRWSYLNVDELNQANTESGSYLNDGAEGVWGTENDNETIEVGKEYIYRGHHAEDCENQVFELEARRGDGQLFTEINNVKAGQFFTLAFDVAQRGHKNSPLAIFLEASDGTRTEVYNYQQSRDWTSEKIHFQTPTTGDYKVVFESTDDDSYGALLDNIKLETLNNVGFEGGFFPVNDITITVGGGLDIDNYKVKLDVSDLPNDSIFKVGDTELSADGNGYIDVSDYDGDLSGLSVQVNDAGRYSFDVVVQTTDNIEVKSSSIELNVLPEGFNLQIGTDGADIINADIGNDILIGLDEADIFAWESSDLDGGLDIIEGFIVGEDHLDLSELLESNETIDDLLNNVTTTINDNDVTLTITRGAQSQSIQLNDVVEQLNSPINEQLSLLVTDTTP
ncbi:cadherin-like domain-containing protein [Vibrio sp. 404]|uniref:Cadherin-like domain-containing protein n=1 Tax=Vibrio marinisediminis TaxID=2758441 RepID=A0A7W2IUH2_9VIBR|nr:cadherin-like domain-containing protein [Vibrio marinisediminis]MBA5763238.1 cadherin-like domain-containing protein [Vibrio marinisediminis]